MKADCAAISVDPTRLANTQAIGGVNTRASLVLEALEAIVTAWEMVAVGEDVNGELKDAAVNEVLGTVLKEAWKGDDEAAGWMMLEDNNEVLNIVAVWVRNAEACA